MSRCIDPTCWRVPHDRLDHGDPGGVLVRLADGIAEGQRDLAARIEARIAATGRSATTIARDQVIAIIREEAAR